MNISWHFARAEKGELWARLRGEIIDKSNPQIFVVLATAGCCNREALSEAVVDRSKRTPETAQLMHLLDGLNSYARQLGARLLVRDHPYEATLGD